MALKTGARLLYPQTSGFDRRGEFSSILNESLMLELAFAPCRDFRSQSAARVVRGMHYQPGLSKLVRCVSGAIVDYVVDLREDHFGVVDVIPLSSHEDVLLHVPRWCAHGYAALVPSEVYYLLDKPHAQGGVILWDSIAADWPFRSPILSERDKAGVPLTTHAALWGAECI